MRVAKGHLRGKQPKLRPRQEAHLVELIRSRSRPRARSATCSASPAPFTEPGPQTGALDHRDDCAQRAERRGPDEDSRGRDTLPSSSQRQRGATPSTATAAPGTDTPTAHSRFKRAARAAPMNSTCPSRGAVAAPRGVHQYCQAAANSAYVGPSRGHEAPTSPAIARAKFVRASDNTVPSNRGWP
jgi:hypothetical protein